MLEIWKDIEGYEGMYQVSNFGNVKREDRHLKPGIGENGYPLVVLSKEGKTKSFYVRRLVASAFLPNPNNLKCINHKDETRTNNRVDNLEWCSYKYNNSYGTRLLREILTKSRKVEQLKNGILIKVWSSTREAQRNGFRSGCISLCCNGKRSSHQGYEWRWSL